MGHGVLNPFYFFLALCKGLPTYLLEPSQHLRSSTPETARSTGRSKPRSTSRDGLHPNTAVRAKEVPVECFRQLGVESF